MGRQSHPMAEKIDLQTEPVRTIRGGCLCGAVRFEFDHVKQGVEMCHCNRCRKATGSAFLPLVSVAAEIFHPLSRQDTIQSFTMPLIKDPPAYSRAFCRNCGSPVPAVHAATGLVDVPAGLLDENPTIRADRHIYVEHAAAWFGKAASVPRLTSTQIRALRESAN